MCDFPRGTFKNFEVLWFSMSTTTTLPLSSGEFCKLRYDTIPVESASANVSSLPVTQKCQILSCYSLFTNERYTFRDWNKHIRGSPPPAMRNFNIFWAFRLKFTAWLQFYWLLFALKFCIRHHTFFTRGVYVSGKFLRMKNGLNTLGVRVLTVNGGYAVAQLVEALCYKSEGRGFDSRSCHWNFSLT